MRSFSRNARLHAELASDPEYQATLRSAARRVKGIAEALSPRGNAHRGYATRFRVTDRRTVRDRDLVEGEMRVENDDPFAHLVEWGSANNPPYAPLRRAARAAGLRLDEDPK